VDSFVAVVMSWITEKIDPRAFAQPGAPSNWRVELRVKNQKGIYDRKVVEVQGGDYERDSAVNIAIRHVNGHRMPAGWVIVVSACQNRDVVRKVIG
jgi:hypothetical protein